MLGYAHDTQHEKIIRGLALGIAMCMYGREDESDALLQELFDHTAREEFSVRHEWSPFELALWDNRATHHRVDNDFGEARRRIHRVTIQGDRPY